MKQELNVKCYLSNKLVIFENKNNDEFTLDFKNKKLGRLLGFLNNSYKGESKYTAETCNSFNLQQLYIYIPNIDETKPVAVCDSKNNIKMLYKSDKLINKLDSVIVQFKNSETTDEIYHDFLGNHFDLELLLIS